MAAIDFFDSAETAWVDMTIYVNGAKTAKATGLSLRVTREKEYFYGAGDEPQSIQSGNKSYTGTLGLSKNAMDAIRRAGFAVGAGDLTDLELQLVADFAPKGSRIAQTLTVLRMQFSEDALDLAQNQKSVSMNLPIMALGIKYT